MTTPDVHVATADAQVLAQALNWFEKPDAQAPPGPYWPPALEFAFDQFAASGMLPSQMRLVEEVLARTIMEIIGHAAAHGQPGDVGILVRHFWHLLPEVVTPTQSLLTGSGSD